jgi:hypothetical protein
LKILDISVPHLNDLLRAWNLISFPH